LSANHLTEQRRLCGELQVRPGETLDVVWSDPCEAPAVVVWHCGESGPAAVAVRVHMDNMERAGEMIPLADDPSSAGKTHVRRRNADYLLARVRPEGASRTLELNDPPNRWLRTTAGGARANPHDADELPELTISVSIKSLGLVATEGSGGRQQELLFVYLNGLQLVVSSGKTFRDSTLNVTGVQVRYMAGLAIAWWSGRRAVVCPKRKRSFLWRLGRRGGVRPHLCIWAARRRGAGVRLRPVQLSCAGIDQFQGFSRLGFTIARP
jgi:hypothetical protein